MRSEQRIAVYWLLTAMSLFAAGDAAAKWLGRTYPVTAAVWIRYLVPAISIAIYLMRQRGLRFAHAPRPKIQILRGLALVCSTLLFWTALSNLPLVEASTVTFVGPTIVVILSSLLLRERPSRDHWVALIIGFTGVMIVLRPGFTHTGIGSLAALGSALCYSLYLVLTRKMTSEADTMTLLFHANAVGAVIMTVIAPANARLPIGFGEWFPLIFLSCAGMIGHWCIIKAYERSDAVTLAPFTYTQLLGATLWGWLLYKDLPDGFTLIGMLVILSAGLYVLTGGGRAWRKEQISSVRSSPE